MNIVAFPAKRIDISVLRAVLEGGLHTMRQAGVVLVGGHSVDDSELKYGLSVTGYIHPQGVLTKKSLRAGDKLLLTKPLGTGIACMAIKAGMADLEVTARLTRSTASNPEPRGGLAGIIGAYGAARNNTQKYGGVLCPLRDLLSF